jgi:hypothetical protein
MTTFTGELREVGAGVASRVAHGAQRLGRTAPAVLGIRLLTGAAAFAAFAAGLPGGGLGNLFWYVVLACVAVAGFPRTAAVTVVTLAVVVAWLIRTLGFGEPAEGWRIGFVACCLYFVHAASALAAVLPYDCVVAPRVLTRWAGRWAAVAGTTLVLAVGGTALVTALPPVRSVVGPIVGSAVAAGLVALLVWQARARRVASEE